MLSRFSRCHSITNRHVIAGAGYFEASLASAQLLSNGQSETPLVDVVIPSPLILQLGESQQIIEAKVGVQDGRLEISSLASNSVQHHMDGHITKASSGFETKSSDSPLSRNILVDSKPGKSAALCSLESRTERSGLRLDPAVFDSFLQLGQVFVSSKDVYVPACLGGLTSSLRMDELTTGAGNAWGSALPLSSSMSMQSDFHMFGLGPHESICCLRSLEAKSMGGTGTEVSKELAPQKTLYEVDHLVTRALDLMAPTSSSMWNLSLNDLGISVVAALKMLEALQGSPRKDLNNLQLQTFNFNNSSPANLSRDTMDSTGLICSALGGYIRSLSQEMPQINWGVQYKDRMEPNSTRCIGIQSPDQLETDQFGITQISNVLRSPVMKESEAVDSLPSYRLIPMPRGSLSSLKPTALDTFLIDSSKVLVEVRAVGINFRDVLNILGMYPGDPGNPGGDCAGVIVQGELKSGGMRLAGPGDAVFGLAGGCLGSHVISSNQTVVPMPTNLTFEQASTMPTVFVTVDTALKKIAPIGKEDKVMVHAAAGGVGLAAMQMIAASGSTPVVTAGSVAKRSMLRSLGAQNAYSSRDLRFSEELVMTCSGANVAINTLTSSGFVACSLASLSRGGTFVEISKRDIWCMERVLQERSDISYNLLAVDFMSAEALHSALMRVSEGVTHNRLRPLPLISHNMASIVDALRQMSQARHIGKIVVMPQVSVDPAIADGSALITGGTGTFGLQ